MAKKPKPICYCQECYSYPGSVCPSCSKGWHLPKNALLSERVRMVNPMHMITPASRGREPNMPTVDELVARAVDFGFTKPSSYTPPSNAAEDLTFSHVTFSMPVGRVPLQDQPSPEPPTVDTSRRRKIKVR